MAGLVEEEPCPNPCLLCPSQQVPMSLLLLSDLFNQIQVVQRVGETGYKETCAVLISFPLRYQHPGPPLGSMFEKEPVPVSIRREAVQGSET